MSNPIQEELANGTGLFSDLTPPQFDRLFVNDEYNERLARVSSRQDLVNLCNEFKLENLLEGNPA